MARDVSIVISAKDNFTQAITTMRNANQAFNKDLTGLQQKLDALNKTKVSLKIEVDRAKAALKEAQKQFMATGDAADKLKLELANIDYDNARRNFELVSKQIKQVEKDILSLTDAIDKSGNRLENRLQEGKGLISTLASAGLTKLVGDTLSNTANTIVNSLYGANVGTMFSSILGSAVSGAAIGSLAGPAGTAVGALVGGIAGAISGATQLYAERDTAFKEYYKAQYESLLEAQSELLTRGTEIAGTREQNLMSFTTLLGGSEKAADFLKQLTEFAARTPFGYDDLTEISKTLLAYGYTQEELLPLLEKIGDAGSALGMTTEDMRYVAIALGRMQVTGKTTLEYLNPLLERGIDVWTYLAKASGKTKEEVQQMVSKGLVPGAEAARAIADYMGAEFAGNMEKQAQTYQGLVSTLEDVQNELENAMGKGYIEERKRGLQREIEFFSGAVGEQMQEAYEKIGQWKASLENLAEQYEREALQAVMTGTVSSLFSEDAKERLTALYEEYVTYASDPSEEAGAKMGRLLAEAQAIAQNEYNASEGAQLLLETNKTLAENLKNDAGIQETYWNAGYVMGQQFTKGLASAITKTRDILREEAEAAWREAINDETRTPEQRQLIKSNKGRFIADYINARSHAAGISYVPYNNYIAILHEGERVLTAAENRSYNKQQNPIIITGNNFYIREEADIPKVAQEVARQLVKAYALAQ